MNKSRHSLPARVGQWQLHYERAQDDNEGGVTPCQACREANILLIPRDVAGPMRYWTSLTIVDDERPARHGVIILTRAYSMFIHEAYM